MVGGSNRRPHPPVAAGRASSPKEGSHSAVWQVPVRDGKTLPTRRKAGLPDPSQHSCVAVYPSADERHSLPIVADRGRAWAVIWPGIAAKCRSLHRISLSSRGATVPMRHGGEAVYYVLAGAGAAHAGDGPAHPIGTGSMVHLAPETEYRFSAGDGFLDLVGGPCPPDPGIYLAPFPATPSKANP